MNQRLHPRFEVQHPVTLEFHSRTYPGCHIINYSLGGLFIGYGSSKLEQQIERGYRETDKRLTAYVTFGSTLRTKIQIHIVHVTEYGLGVIVQDHNQDVFEYLDAIRRKKELTESPATENLTDTGDQPDLSHAVVLGRLKSKLANYLPRHLRLFHERLASEFRQDRDTWQVDSVKAELSYAARSVIEHQVQINEDYMRHAKDAFDRLLGEDADPLTIVDHKFGLDLELELVDQSEFDEWLLLAGLANHWESEFNMQLSRLNYYLSQLLHRSMRNDNNPISPTLMLQNYQAAIKPLSLNPQHQYQIGQIFCEMVIADMGSFYADQLSLWGDSRQFGGTPKVVVNQPQRAPVERKQAYGGERPSNPQVDPIEQKSLGDLAKIVDAFSKSNAINGNTNDAGEVASRESLLNSLKQIKVQKGVPLLNQLEDWLSEQAGPSKKIDPELRSIINVSEELIQSAQTDDLLCEPIRQLINCVEVPFIKEAINDPEMLGNPGHPGRLFLETTGRLSTYCLTDSEERRGPTVYSKAITDLAQRIQDQSITDIHEATHEIELVLEDQIKRFEANKQLAVERCVRMDQRRQAQNLIKQQLLAMLSGKSISMALIKLIQYGWIHLLIHTANLHGAGSAQSRAYLRVMEILSKLRSGNELKLPLPEKHINGMIAVIRKGFGDYPFYAFETDDYIDQLRQALGGHNPELDALINRQDRLSDDELLAPFDAFKLPAKTNMDSPEGVRVKISVDDWLLEQSPSGAKRLLNLAWNSQDFDRYVLVDGNGVKTMELTGAKLQNAIQNKRLKLLKGRENTLIERAIHRILNEAYHRAQDEVNFDELTGALKRRAFERMMTKQLYSDLMVESASLLMLDVDRFGLVNDLCGYEGGDQVLQKITSIVRNHLPDDVLFGRTGDDEFCVLLPGKPEVGLEFAEMIRIAVERYSFEWDGQMLPVTASVGVVAVDATDQTTAGLLKSAASASNLAKRAGRNCTRVYRESDAELIQHKQLIKSVAQLKAAMDQGRILLMAQRIEPLKPFKDSHYEILMRFQTDDGKTRGPFELISAAEHYGIMPELDRWVIRQFFKQIDQVKQLDGLGGFSLNLSGESLADESFKAFLKEQIENTGLPKDKLAFELTETALVKDMTQAIRFIEEVQAMGCQFYLDDFGSGFASFGYLKDLPVDTIKIDGLFIRDILEDQTSHTMVNAVTEIAHFLGKQVIAEYVENEPIAETLKQIGVDYIQGYYLGEPVKLKQLLAEWDAAGG